MPDFGSRGSIVLAAFRPDPVLFARQLHSIRDQTHADFECLIGADGDEEAIRELANRTLDADARFRVVGFDDRVGFYRNFERLLGAIDPRSGWIALSDQDDLWYPDKLETLLPELARHTLVSGQARLVAHPSGAVIAESTVRHDVEPVQLVINNQFTGSLSVFRPELLDLALPFPALASRAQVHDHWLAVCAAALGGAHVVDTVVQDYVQHPGNALGESRLAESRFNPGRLWATLRQESARYEGSASLGALARYRYNQVLGWDAAMTLALAARLPASHPVVDGLRAIYAPHRRIGATLRFLARSVGTGFIPAGTALLFLQGWLLEPYVRRPA